MFCLNLKWIHIVFFLVAVYIHQLIRSNLYLCGSNLFYFCCMFSLLSLKFSNRDVKNNTSYPVTMFFVVVVVYLFILCCKMYNLKYRWMICSSWRAHSSFHYVGWLFLVWLVLPWIMIIGHFWLGVQQFTEFLISFFCWKLGVAFLYLKKSMSCSTSVQDTGLGFCLPMHNIFPAHCYRQTNKTFPFSLQFH